MPDTVFPNLPELDAQLNSVPNPKTAGEWHRAPWSGVGHVANSLDLKSQPGAHVIHKLPDIWARVTMVDLALSMGPRHPLYGTARDAFRGLVAIIALWRRRQLPFRIEKIDLSAFIAAPRAGRLFGLDTADRDRATGLSLSQGTKWSKPCILMLDDSPIGLTSPVTLLCPLFGFEASRAVGAVPWWQSGSLVDPTEHLSPEHRAWVVRWIEATKSGLTSLQGANPALSNRILAELDEFAGALGETAAAGSLVQGVPSVANGACELLTYTAPPRSDTEWSAELALTSERADKRLLVIERTTPAQWHKPSRDISVLSAVTFDTLENRWDDVRRGLVELGPLPANTEYVFADQLFLPRVALVRVEAPEQAFPGALGAAGSDAVRHKWEAEPLLPIAPRLASFLEPRAIVEAAEYRILGDRLRVELKLTLRGGKVTIARDYAAEELIFIEAPPIVEVWPSFSSPRWHTYFTFWGEHVPQGTFSVAPVYQFGVTVDPPVVERKATTDAPLRQVIRSTAPPRGFSCQLSDADIGLLAVELPRPDVVEGASSWRIGIDFGTTNTTVYYSADGGTPQLLTLGGLETHQVTGAGKADRLDWLNRFFMPPREQTPGLPFLSMYRTRRPGAAPIVDGNIAFVRIQDQPNLFDASISSDLKWSEGPGDREKTQAMLGETLLLALAQAVRSGVKNVTVATAYPSAFWPTLQQTLAGAWNSCISEAARVVDVTLGGNVESFTESEAVARFFEGTDVATMHQGALVVDIGGGSSDLAYWRDNKLLWQASVHLAGKALLTEALHAVESSGPAGRRDIEGFWPEQAFRQVLKGSHQSLESDRGVYDRQVEALLARAGHELAQRLTQHGGNPSLQFVIRHLALGLGGLLWYAGTAQAWNDERHSLAPDNVNVYAAGNGSRLWHWLCHGTFNQASLKGFVEAMVRAGTGRKTAIKMNLSGAPKSEVAAGLVVKSTVTAVDPWNPSEEVFAGEEVKVNGAVEDVLHRANVIGAQSIEVPVLSNLNSMLDAFNGHSKRGGWFWPALTDGELEMLKSESLSDVRQKLSGWSSTGRDDLHLEPVFVLGLRQLLRRHLDLIR